MIKIIIGPRSIGKTTIGIALSKKLNESYFDFDKFVEEKLNGINNHIKENSIESYRLEETIVLIEFLKNLPNNCIISLGGGTIASQFESFNKKNIELLYDVGTIIYLSPSESFDESIKILHEREIKREGSKTLNEIKELFPLRKSIYEKIANINLMVERKPKDQVVKELIKKL